MRIKSYIIIKNRQRISKLVLVIGLCFSTCAIIVSQKTITNSKGQDNKSFQNDSTYTILYDNYLKKIINDSVVIEEYGIIKDGHSFRKEGFYAKRNNKGKLLVLGEYLYNRKTGRWTYFYANGTIKRIENYSLPFHSHLYDLNIMLLHQIGPFLNGNQVEYYPNGQIKLIGTYKIYDLKMKEFEVVDRDPNTFEEIPVSIKSEFWVPTSIKTGKWIKFDEGGEIIKEDNYKVEFNNQIRYTPIDPKLEDYDYLKKGSLNGVPY